MIRRLTIRNRSRPIAPSNLSPQSISIRVSHTRSSIARLLISRFLSHQAMSNSHLRRPVSNQIINRIPRSDTSKLPLRHRCYPLIGTRRLTRLFNRLLQRQIRSRRHQSHPFLQTISSFNSLTPNRSYTLLHLSSDFHHLFLRHVNARVHLLLTISSLQNCPTKTRNSNNPQEQVAPSKPHNPQQHLEPEDPEPQPPLQTEEYKNQPPNKYSLQPTSPQSSPDSKHKEIHYKYPKST